MKIFIPISVGELLDKITILQLKSEHTINPYVNKELEQLISIAKDHGVYKKEYLDDLLKINKKLWEIEDSLREHEYSYKFDSKFISLARNVYITNDKRFKIKKRIDEETGSEYREVKTHK